MKVVPRFDDALCCIMFVGLGQMILFLAAPNLYTLLSRDIENPGTGLSTNDFQIEALQPMMQWLVDTVGALGLSFSLAVVGIALVVVGMREFLRGNVD